MQERKLTEFLDFWLDGIVGGSVRQNTRAAYGGYVKNHIAPYFERALLMGLRTEAVQKFVSDMSERLSPRTVRAVFSMLKSALNMAAEFGYIAKNPCNAVKLPKVDEREVRVFCRADQQRLESAALASNDKRNIGVMICLYTGIRIGELCALKWENVDFENGSIRITASLGRINNRGGVKKTEMAMQKPKTRKSKRTIPLPEFLSGILKRHKNESGGVYVVSMRKNGRYVQPRTMQNIYAGLLKTAGMEHINFHSLRHTFATRALELGTDIKTISDILGHSNSAITLNRYVHSTTEQKRSLMQNMDTFFNGNGTF
jgi:integrase